MRVTVSWFLVHDFKLHIRQLNGNMANNSIFLVSLISISEFPLMGVECLNVFVKQINMNPGWHYDFNNTGSPRDKIDNPASLLMAINAYPYCIHSFCLQNHMRKTTCFHSTL